MIFIEVFASGDCIGQVYFILFIDNYFCVLIGHKSLIFSITLRSIKKFVFYYQRTSGSLVAKCVY
jgi:hypothetical protein